MKKLSLAIALFAFVGSATLQASPLTHKDKEKTEKKEKKAKKNKKECTAEMKGCAAVKSCCAKKKEAVTQ